VGAFDFDSILSHIDGLANSQPKTIFVHFIMQFYVCFSALWKATINDDKTENIENIVGLRSHVACPDF